MPFRLPKRVLATPVRECCRPLFQRDRLFPSDPPTPPVLLPLILTFNDINNTGLVLDPSDVNEWNGVIVAGGTAYTSAVVVGNSVELYGGSGVTFAFGFFGNTEFTGIDDQALSIVALPTNCFQQCQALLNVKLDAVTQTTFQEFESCIALQTVSMALLETIGQQTFNGTSFCSTAIFPKVTLVMDGGCQGMGSNSGLTITIPLLEECEGGAFSASGILGDYTFNYLTTCGSGVFSDCASLATLSLPVLSGSVGNSFCRNCFLLTSFSAPLLTSIGYAPGGSVPGTDSFEFCYALTTLYIPLCAQLGGSVGDDGTFNLISGNTIAVTCSSVLQTCDGGLPDGDLVYLLANNPLSTITYV